MVVLVKHFLRDPRDNFGPYCTVFVLYHYCITYFIVLDLYCTLLYLYFIATVFVPYHYFIDPLIVKFGLYLYCTTMESMLSLITYGSGAYIALHL